MKELDDGKNISNTNNNNDNIKKNNENNINDINDINSINNIESLDSSKKIIMKCNPEFLTFDKKNYYPSILVDYIPRNEWEAIAEDGNLVIGNAYNLRKLEEKVKIPKNMNVIFWIIFCFSLFDFLFLIIYSKNEEALEIFIYSGMALILIACAIGIGLMFYNYTRELKEEKKIDEFIIEGMTEYMTELNNKYENIASFKYNHERLEIECLLKNKNLNI